MTRRSDAGLTLVEVLSALSIFAVVATGMAKGTISSVRTNAFSKEAAMAAALVQDSLEKFRAIDPTTNSALLTAGNHTDSNNPITSLGTAGGYFTRAWNVTASTPRSGMSKVVVTVSWTNETTRTMSGVAYICSTSTCS